MGAPALKHSRSVVTVAPPGEEYGTGMNPMDKQGPVPAGALDAQRLGMIRVPPGTLLMGSNDHYREDAPVHPAHVDGF